MNYEKYYSKNIEKLYYFQNKLIHNFNKNNIIDFNISSEERINLTHLDVYSIDPENCEDVDDAFSYFEDNNKKYIVIHIADPTDHIKLFSNEFNSIIEKSFTRYPSNRKPIHLMTKNILDKSTLHENIYGNVKKALSLIIEFNENNELNYNNTIFYFTIIKVKSENKLSYNNVPQNNFVIKNCLKLSEFIFPNLIYNNSTKYEVKFKNNSPYFYKNNELECKYKKMIAKFAIFSNNYIAYLLKKHLNNDHIIFRKCPVINSEELSKHSVNFNDFMYFILNNNISADYDNINSNHDLLQLDEYLHMTSPIRRSVDCVIHYLLKSIYLNIKIPFNENEISTIINQSNIVNKKLKKIQFRDNKFRFLHALEKDLINHDVNYYKLQFYISSFKKPYLNIIIYQLNNESIYLSYTLKINNNIINNNLINVYHNCFINKVNCCNFYDEGSLPDLDLYILSLLS